MVNLEQITSNIEKEKQLLNKIQESNQLILKTKIQALKQKVMQHVKELEQELKTTAQQNLTLIGQLSLIKPLPQITPKEIPTPISSTPSLVEEKKQQPPQIVTKERQEALQKLYRLSDLDRDTIKRIKKPEERKKEEKEKDASPYVRFASKLFYDTASSILKRNQKYSEKLRRELIQSNLRFVPANYLSVIILTTLLSFGVAFLVYVFFLFFSISSSFPIISIAQEGLGIRALKFIWILIIIPLGTFIVTYIYPNLEKGSIGRKIDAELPFATIHMSAISGSMINPTEIFRIISLTKEYPNLEKEFNKLLNEVNVYGHDIVSALRRVAFNTPSKDLSELLNGLAITITSGGNLPEFFEKRSQTLLFGHRIDQEKRIKSSETFMDIYISVVIAAPMILMLVLMMMKISGLGISLSTSLITLIMVVGVSVINIIFLTFLHLKQSTD